MKTKIYKVLSVVLAMIMIFSTCMCAVTSQVSAADTTATGKTKEYYISSAGDDSFAGNKMKPRLTLAGAVQKALEAGYKAGDTVIVKVMGTDLVQWGAYTTPTHAFKLIIESESSGAKIGYTNSGILLGGPTEFRNIAVDIALHKTLRLNNNDVVFGEGSSIVNFAGRTIPIGGTTDNSQRTTPQNLEFNCNMSSALYIGDSNAGRSFLNPINITYNHASTPTFNLSAGADASSNQKTYYKNALNFNIKQATGLKFVTNANKPCYFKDNGTIQIIDSAGIEITGLDGLVLTGDGDTTSALPKYILRNKSGVISLLEFTETIGKYAVDTNRFTVTATPVGGGTAVVAKDGFLTVTPGEYNITATKVAESKTLYVEDGADGTNDTYASIQDAITAAMDLGYVKGDIITLKLKGSSVDLGTLPKYGFNLIVESDSQTVRTKIKTARGATIANNEGSTNWFNNVEFDNTHTDRGGEWTFVYLASSNAIFDENTKFTFGYGTMICYGTSQDGGAAKSIAGQNVEFNGTLPFSLNVSNSGYSARTYTEDVNLVVNSSSTARIHLNASSSNAANGTTKFNKNFNINVKKSSAASFEYGKNVTVNGALQIINSTSSVFKLDTAGIADVTASKKIIINNDSGNGRIIEFTNETGVFKVIPPKATSTVVIKDSAGNIIPEVDGKVTITDSGVYYASIVKEAESATYYVEEGADGTNDTYPTIAAAISAAISADYTKGDTITIKLKGESVTMGTLPAYKFNLIVTSDSATLRTKISFESNLIIANNEGAKTTYDNVEFYTPNQWKNIFMYSSNVVLTSSVYLNGGYGLSLYYGSGNDSKTVAGQTVEINSNITYAVSLSNLSYAGPRTYTEDVNLIINTTSKPNINFNASDSGKSNGRTIYEKNLNLILKKAGGIGSFNYGENVTVNGALNILNSTTTDVNIEDEQISKIACGNVYVLNNKSGEMDLVEVTDSVGVFKVTPSNPSYLVYAVDQNGDSIYAQDGLLTLVPGQYEVRIDRDPIIREYYISATGVEFSGDVRPADLGTRKNPVKSFADATRLIALDNMADIDIAKVYLIGDSVDWASDSGAAVNYACTVELDAASAGEQPILYSYNSITFVGNTIVKSVQIHQGYQWSSFRFGHNNVVFEEESYLNVPTAYIGFSSSPSVIDKDVNITLKGKVGAAEIALGSEYHSGTYNGDINLVFDNDESNAAIQFGGSGIEKQTYVYNGNLNITILKAKSFSFGQSSKCTVTFNGAIQTIVDDSVLLPYSTQTKFNALEVDGGKWYITNAATDDDFVQFTSKSGEFAIKDGKKAYIRQTLAESQTTEKSGLLKLSDGVYTVSDKSIPFLPDESHKMLYFMVAGGGHHLASRAKVTPGETYVFEFSVFCNLYEDLTPCVRDDGDRGVTCTPVIISEEKIGDYYKIVCEATIPETYNYGSTAFFGVNLYSYSEGVIFDRTVYNKNDPEKKDCFEKNQFLHDGLDGVALDMKFWGGTFTGIRGGTGVVRWENEFQKLEVVSFSEAYIKELIRLSNPDDGKWWNDKDIIEEEIIVTYSSANGTFKDQEGNAIKGAKFVLASATNEYKATTDKNGKFVFGEKVTGYNGKKIISDFYELFILNGDERIATGFTQYIAENETISFDVVSDLSKFANLSTDSDLPSSDSDFGTDNMGDQDYQDVPSYDYEEVNPGDEIEEITPSGDLYGTVYTPLIETVAGVRIYLEGIDGQVSSNQEGKFGFKNLPVGKYRIYTVLPDGTEYNFTEVEILENSETTINLKYDPPKTANNDSAANNGWIIWVIVASVVALAVVAVLIFFLVIKKKKI